MQEENTWKTTGKTGKEIIKNGDMDSNESYTHPPTHHLNKTTNPKKRKEVEI